jgi:hypothetical protein
VCFAQEAKTEPAPAAKPTMKLVLPDEVKYGPLPPELVVGKPAFETSGTLEVAVLVGDPTKPGNFSLLAHCTNGYKVAPHWHPKDENVVVLQGEFAMGMGSRWNPDAMNALPARGFASIPGAMRHFAQCNGDTLMEIHGGGPFTLNFVSAPAQPAKKSPAKKSKAKKTSGN